MLIPVCLNYIVYYSLGAVPCVLVFAGVQALHPRLDHVQGRVAEHRARAREASEQPDNQLGNLPVGIAASVPILAGLHHVETEQLCNYGVCNFKKYYRYTTESSGCCPASSWSQSSPCKFQQDPPRQLLFVDHGRNLYIGDWLIFGPR